MRWAIFGFHSMAVAVFPFGLHLINGGLLYFYTPCVYPLRALFVFRDFTGRRSAFFVGGGDVGMVDEPGEVAEQQGGFL